MARPVRAYLIRIAERLHMPIKQAEQVIDTEELLWWLAYDRLTDEDWQKKYKEETMTPEERDSALLALFGFREDGDQRNINDDLKG